MTDITTTYFQQSCDKIENIKNVLYFTFNEGKYLQSNKYIQEKQTFKELLSATKRDIVVNKKNAYSPTESIEKIHNLREHVIVKYPLLIDVFFNLVDPLKSRRESIDELLTYIDKNIYLLKTITARYKQLHGMIVNNMYITNMDNSYSNKNYMLFWSNLLNASIYIIENNMYINYLGNSCHGERFIVIAVQHAPIKFELKKTCNFKNFSEFNMQCKYKKWYDPNSLNSYTIKELKEICTEFGISIDPKSKKSDIQKKLAEIKPILT
jgi:hypothetical protein